MFYKDSMKVVIQGCVADEALLSVINILFVSSKHITISALQSERQKTRR